MGSTISVFLLGTTLFIFDDCAVLGSDCCLEEILEISAKINMVKPNNTTDVPESIIFTNLWLAFHVVTSPIATANIPTQIISNSPLQITFTMVGSLFLNAIPMNLAIKGIIEIITPKKAKWLISLSNS